MTGLFSTRGVAGGLDLTLAPPFLTPTPLPTTSAFSSPRGPMGLYPSLPLGARLKLLMG